MTSWWLNMIGIIFSTAGTILMFYGSPRDSKFTDQPVPVMTAKINGEGEQIAFDKRRKRSRWGVVFLLCGLGMQTISQIIQYP